MNETQIKTVLEKGIIYSLTQEKWNQFVETIYYGTPHWHKIKKDKQEHREYGFIYEKEIK